MSQDDLESHKTKPPAKKRKPTRVPGKPKAIAAERKTRPGLPGSNADNPRPGKKAGSKPRGQSARREVDVAEVVEAAIETPQVSSFSALNLPNNLLSALEAVGYEIPSPIQCLTIPPLLAGRDVLGHAPTGTGKTAAFALPLLSRLDLNNAQVQIMVLAPTRELAIQVAEAFQKYAAHIPGFRVLPIYGGQAYGGQINQLKRGVHAVVGTPGRVMDHMRKGTLKLDGLQALVLDEADEMLRMGFIDDVEWILEQTPEKRQIALFSATMPKQVERIARRHLHDPEEISIKNKTATASTIRQRYWSVSHMHKLDALTRILEVETFEAIILFVRTKIATIELADKLEARGYAAAAINGDMQQKLREQTIENLKRGKLDILVATDVAARGLDVDRISHVINYDIPYDAEAYIHRIGRTGRAGRTGEAILFVAPREKRMLSAIEQATRQKIEELELPTTEMVNNKRIADFKQKITDVLAAGELEFFRNLLEQYQQERDVPGIEIAAAMAKMQMGDRSLLITEKPQAEKSQSKKSGFSDSEPGQRSRRTKGSSRNRDEAPAEASPRRSGKRVSKSEARPPEGMERYRIEVGHSHAVQPGNIVGAIANEAGVDASNIGHIDIHTDHSLVDLPLGMPKDIFRDLKKVWVCGRQLHITKLDDNGNAARKPRTSKPDASKATSSKASTAGGSAAKVKPRKRKSNST